MTDIVERLGRQYDEWNNPPSPELPEGAGILLEAKAEVERLRAALEEIEMASFPLERESVRVLCVPIGAWDNAMRALESK